MSLPMAFSALDDGRNRCDEQRRTIIEAIGIDRSSQTRMGVGFAGVCAEFRKNASNCTKLQA